MYILSNVQRVINIGLVLSKHGLSLTIGRHLRRWDRLANILPNADLSGPKLLRMVLEDIGGTFIKFGQMLALQPDILPLEYCNELFQLLDRITPFASSEVDRIFIEELGKRPSEIFDHFDLEPIATASIGQVYTAYLDGRKLAVKVQRPSVQEDFAGDIRLMSATIRIVQGLHLKKLYWILEPLSEFISWTHEELDFRFEIRYMEQLRQNARDNAKEYIPPVVWQYSTSRVLTLEFLEGVTLMNYIRGLEEGEAFDLDRLPITGFDPDRFARNIIENFLNDAFHHGMFHADLHPANLMIMPNSVVGYIDFGITGVLSPYLRRHLVALTLAYSRGDLDGMWSAFFKVSALDKSSDVEAFRHGLSLLAEEWYAAEGEGGHLVKNITLVMLDLLKLSRQTSIWPERDVIKYIRSAIAIDGLITRFAPGFDVGKYLEMICHRYLQWYGYHELVTFNALLEWSKASSHLLQDGVSRVSALLDHVNDGNDYPMSPLKTVGIEEDDVKQEGVLLALVMFTTSLLMVLTEEKIRFGLNIFTAEAILLVYATLRLLRRLPKLF